MLARVTIQRLISSCRLNADEKRIRPAHYAFSYLVSKTACSRYSRYRKTEHEAPME